MKTIKKLQDLFLNPVFSAAYLHASAACYYMMLSMIPAAMFLLTIFEAIPLLTGFSLLSWLWSASKGIHAVTAGFHAILSDLKQRSYLHKRFRSVLQFLLICGCFAAAAAAVVVGTELFHFGSHPFLYSHLLMSVLIALLYRLHPGKKIVFRACICSAMIVAGLSCLFSFLFGIYVNHFALQYRWIGGLGSMMLIMIWMRICLIILFLGIRYAAFLSDHDYTVFHSVRRFLQYIHE